MADLLIRNMDEGVLSALSDLAKGAGYDNRMDYVRAELVKIASAPLVKERYAIKVYGEQGEGIIRRYGDGQPGGGCKNLSQEEFDAYKKANFYVERNQPGDREKALMELGKAFQEVSEVAM
jgi:hypothetical protein